ncbi:MULTISPECIES: ABC transporter ATP-binding protein [Prauserella salsuginis group]|uniref:ABC-type dipeptide/oligopeptide/nickel transport system ATPase component n=2 Tax=Prauserella salsuginis group TaxID=2893672 RepID=A0A839XVX8_9PSEU|nr:MULTISPECIES: ABC transporter ATP-binding protein [Prauserella salsuginis group]MBB3664673.1 ABC-type dipeptide/oligopeptide/nickel transport system ATPase component [Prauserella sediminis]MCR3722139.1 peptide/nickel transport system ATP-binding protein [Prauserella flava]MCR3736136.1 peptide/nickel transport system ATP-binding protein [Prauserella salsuginis]
MSVDSATDELLAVENLAVRLPGPDGPVTVLEDVSLSVRRGEIVGIAGESGSGKSMTARTLLDLLPAGAEVSGRLRFDGAELDHRDRKAMHAVRGHGIAMVFQDPTAAMHPMLSIGRQLTEHMSVHLGLTRKQAKARAVELLEQVRLPDPGGALRSYPHQFSGGQLQRIAIASALAARPKLLIADEPTTALDVTVQAGILGLLDSLRSELDLSVLFITHDLGVLAALATHTCVFQQGRVVESAPTADLLRAPEHPYTRALLAARTDPAEVP